MKDADRKLSRRKLLIAGGLTVAAGVLIAKPLKTIAPRRSSSLVRQRLQLPSLATADYETWLAQVGSIFVIGPGVRIALKGIEPLQSGGDRPPGVARENAFLLAFDPVGGATMAGDLIYMAVHPQLGAVNIFLQASPDRATPARMLAVFN